MENNKNLWIGVVVVVILVFVFYFMNKNSTPVVINNTVDNQGVVSTEDTSAGSINAGVSVAPISYASALIKYKNARIQLDKMCQATPNNVTYKNNASIMIDNRAPVARTVKVGSVFSVKAWGFKIIKLSSATLPSTWLVDCDKSQNVATVLIQK
jgi:hypothetical protein